MIDRYPLKCFDLFLKNYAYSFKRLLKVFIEQLWYKICRDTDTKIWGQILFDYIWSTNEVAILLYMTFWWRVLVVLVGFIWESATWLDRSLSGILYSGHKWTFRRKKKVACCSRRRFPNLQREPEKSWSISKHVRLDFCRLSANYSIELLRMTVQ